MIEDQENMIQQMEKDKKTNMRRGREQAKDEDEKKE